MSNAIYRLLLAAAQAVSLSPLALLVTLVLLAGTARGAEPAYPGPYAAEVVEVVDGDTIRVRAAIWPGVEAPTLVRVAGIDTPELRTGACRAAGAAARDHLAALAGRKVVLRQVVADKYGGRVRADVTAGALHLASEMIGAGLAREYHGAGKANWCPPP